MKIIKKISSIILVLTLLVSCFSIGLFKVSAATISESEDNNSYANANQFDANSSITGKLNNSADKDYYKIVVPENGKLTITFKHLYTEKDIYWKLNVYKYVDGEYKKAWESIAGSFHIYGNSNESKSFPVIGATKGSTYYVQIDSYSYSYPVGVNYTIENTFIATENYEKEFNGSYYIATKLGINKSLSGNVSTDSDKDYYKIEASKKGYLTINFKHKYVESSSVKWIVSTYQYANGQYDKLFSKSIYGNSNENTSLQPFEVQKDGIYYVVVVIDSYAYQQSAAGREYEISNKFSINNPSSSVVTTTTAQSTESKKETTTVKQETTTQQKTSTTTEVPTETTTQTETTTIIYEATESSTTENVEKNSSDSKKFIIDLDNDINNEEKQSELIIVIVALLLIATGILLFIIYTIKKERNAK